MNPKKLTSLLTLVEASINNLNSVRKQLQQEMGVDSGVEIENKVSFNSATFNDEPGALEVVEGYFNGEQMIGDNGKTYTVPPNYASKTQLVTGDRLKRILTEQFEKYKLIKPVERKRVTATFVFEPEGFYAELEDGTMLKLLKASATFAIKNLGLQPGMKLALLVPKEGVAAYGTLSSVLTENATGEIIERDISPNPYSAGNLADMDYL
jgi:hypothetical protein